MSEGALQLQLWQLRIDDISAADLRRGLSWLSRGELEYFRGCASAVRKRQFALGRLLLRGALSHLETSHAPGQWRFAEGARGRPSLVPEQPFIGFNLAHSNNRVILVTGPLQVLGIDLENGRKKREVERLARRWFHPPELAELMRLDPSARQTWFYRLWTLKEAWSKANGDSLAAAMARLTIAGVDNERFAALVDGEEAPDWQLLRLCVAPGFHCALACRSESPISLTTRRMSGLARFEAGEIRIAGSSRSAA